MVPKDPKTYLWSNVAALMREESPTVDAVQAKTKVGRGSVQRIKAAETSVGLDILAAVAKAFRIEVWQLLVPGIDPDNLPALSSGPGSQWPFTHQLLAACRHTEAATLRQAENAARVALDMDPLPRLKNANAA